MIVSIWIDGWPYLVEFTGTIEVERMWDGETVALRGEGLSVKMDEEEIREHREILRKIREAALIWDRDLWPGLFKYE